MKTFSKRFLTMLLAVSMVFGLSGMTTFAAEADDASAQDDTASGEETATASEDESATLSSDEDGIQTLTANTINEIELYHNGMQVGVITEDDFRKAELAVQAEKDEPDTFAYYNGSNHETRNEVTAWFVKVSDLLEIVGTEPDVGCGAFVNETDAYPFTDMDNFYLYDDTENGSGIRSAADGEWGQYWVTNVTRITLGHDFDSNGICRICQMDRDDYITYNVKYAVCLWGIEQNKDRYGNTLGLTFGPATGADYTNSYKAHLTQEEYESGEKGICLHWMTWDEIIALSKTEEGLAAFKTCLENGCTHSVNLKLNSTLLSTDYFNQMNLGDGAGMLYDSINSSYRTWNETNTSSTGWPASQIRAVLNGRSRQTDDSATNALDSSDCLFSCFPSELKDAIVPAVVTSDTVYDSEEEESAQTTYDRLWLPSGKEVYKESADGENNAVIRPNEGTISQRSEALGITTKENLSLLNNYDETGTANSWRLRSLSASSDSGSYAYQVAADGNFAASQYNTNTVGIAPCFCLRGQYNKVDESYYDVKYAVSVWGINHDINKDGNILGLTFGPATGADYRHDYVAHISEEEYIASQDTDEKEYCIHWMSWEEIAAQAEDDPAVFKACLESGCTHAVNLTLNDTIMGASYADDMDDGDGVSGLLNCIKLWKLDPPYDYVSASYRYWNSTSWTTGGWPASQIRAVLNGKDDLLGDYAAYALDEKDALFSCFPESLQELIEPKAVPSATVAGSEEKEDITLTGDNLWLFSSTEVMGYTGENRDSYLNPAEGALYERSAQWGITTAASDARSRLVGYDEEGTAKNWFLRSFESGSSVEYVSGNGGYVSDISLVAENTSSAPGFCLGVTEAVAGDKSALRAEYDEDIELDQYDYTADSWEVFAAALKNAKALLDAGAVTEDVLEEALETLQAAKEDLVTTINRTKLQAEYDEDVLLKENNYTAESWTPFAEALEAAEELLNKTADEIQEQSEVDAALAALQEAKAGLVYDFRTATLDYAVKIWGIGADMYFDDEDECRHTTGLTFGPATGADYIDDYHAHLTQDQYDPENGQYCIHWMSWEDINEQSKEDPSVFEECMEYGCTKSVELNPNETLFNLTAFEHYLDQEYTGDGVGTLYYLLNGTGSAGYSYGADWNYSTNGYSGSAPANLYSESRIRITLNGDSSDANLKYASSTGDGSDLCDDTNSLLSCFPEDLQDVIVPRETKNDRNATTGFSADDETTYDKLFLFSTTETGFSGTRDGSGGNDYGVCSTDADRIAYEFSGTDASSSAARAWWSRSRYISSDYQSLYVSTSGSETYTDAGYAAGLSPCFCLAGPKDVVNKTELQAAYAEAEALNGEDYTTDSWETLVEKRAAAKDILDATDVTQKQVDDAYTALRNAMDELEDALSVSFTSITAEGIEGDDVTIFYGASFDLATTVSVAPADATLTYQWYEVAEDGKTATEIEGETNSTLTLSGTMSDSGTYKCVVTASSDQQGEKDADTSITVTITDEAMVNYAVKIWGIGHDTYSYETKKISHGTDVKQMDAGLTFGPATGDNEEGDGTGFLNSYKAHLTEEQYKEDEEAYCIHWMSWEEIAEQSKTKPEVFDVCMKNGCTKAVEISLNEKLANRTTVNSYLNLEDPYTGDGVAALYYLINGTNNSTASATFGANWNYSIYSLSGQDYTDRANLYSRSRIRTTLTGDSEDARAQVAAGGTDYYDLATVCDETNCLFSCFPEELQKVIVPRLTLNSGGTGGGNDPNADRTDTFDKLFLFSMRETGVVDSGTRGDFDDAGGYDYGINESNSDRIAYEFTGTSATDIGGVSWWTRSRYDEWSNSADRILADGGFQTNANVTGSYGLAPGFCLPGPDDATVTPTMSDVTVTSDINGNSKAYDSKGVTLTVSATTEPVSANVSYQWYKVEDGVDTAIDHATSLTLALDGNVSDSGTYKCVASAWSGGEIVTGSDTIVISITVAEQDISYASTEISKTTENMPFTNELTITFVDPADGSGITYACSDERVATVDAATGEVTLMGIEGTATITATAAATDNCAEATVSYTITVTADKLPTNVRYAVQLWGINRDVDEDGNTLGLTFGPAIGADYTDNYKAHLTEEEYKAREDAYCIHWMGWDEIIEQSKEDPKVFADCLSNGCTKAVDLTTANNPLFNMTAVENVLQQNYSGDGVGTLYYLLSGTTYSASSTQGEGWNLTRNGFSDTDPANVYSRSRIRNILTGDKTEIEEWITEYPNYNDYYGIDTLCDETNCLLSCFPEELQSAIVPRETVNAGEPVSGTSYNDKTTYDQLFLFSITEVGLGSGYDYNDGGGTDYGIASRDSQRVAYEFSGVDGATSETQGWWARSRSTYNNCQASGVLLNGSRFMAIVQDTYGVSPGFCLAGSEEPEPEEPTVSVTIESTLNGQDDTKTYDGVEVTLTATATVQPESAEISSYQWYKDGVAIEDATYAVLNIDGNVSDSGTYKCVVTATNGGLTADAEGEIMITIKKATQEIVFEEEEVTKTIGDGSFTNKLSGESVVFGTLSYESSNDGVANVDENGLVTLVGIGETTITVTAAGSNEGNYDAVSASYTLTVKDVDKTALQEECDEDVQLIETDYNEATWVSFMTALSNAETVLLDSDASQDDVDTALRNLQIAKAGLEAKPAEKEVLETEIASTEDLIESDYTEESWTALEEALTAAEAVDNNGDALQSEVDAAAETLQDAITSLVSLEPDKSVLNAAIDVAESLDESEYTADSWSVLQAALEDAKTVYEDTDAKKSEVKAAELALLDAIANLESEEQTAEVDKSVLNAVIEVAESLDKDEGNYTADSWDALQEALTIARGAATSDESTQEEVDNATVALVEALAKLEPEEQPAAVDKSVLNEVIEVAAALSNEDGKYTADSWDALQEALTTARGAATSDEATQEEVDNATVALVEALAKLEIAEQPAAVDKSVLNAVITAAESLSNEDDKYTEGSWKALQEALSDAKEVSEGEATQEEVNSATTALVEALADLELAEQPAEADKSVLDAAVTAAESLSNEDDKYTDTSWTNLQNALIAAQGVLTSDEATQEDVDDATVALVEALADLEFAEQPAAEVDKSVLDAAVTAAESLSNDDDKYTEGSWNALQDALTAAQDVAASGEATQEEVDSATTALVEALADLELAEQSAEADKSVLNAVITAAESLSNEDDKYTADSWNALQEALTTAQGVAEKDDATQEDVDNATTALVEALANLEPEEQPAAEVDKSVLDAAVTATESLNNDDGKYTEDSWSALQDALTAAQGVAANDDASQEDVNNATTALVNALAGLEPAETSEPTPTPSAPKNGLCRIVAGELWGYYVDDVVDTSYTGFVKNDNGTWYVENGYVDFAKNSVYKDTKGEIGNAGTWYYVVGNKVQYGFTGLAHYRNANGWWYIVNGVVDFTHNGVDKNQNGWWYVTNGKVQFGFTGLANYKNENGWWYISGGKVDFNHNGVDKNKNGWWYVTGGKVQFGFTGLAHYKNANGWWYIKGGKVTFDYTGIASNQNGTWYVKDSKVDFSYNGRVTSGGTTYTVRNGKVT